MSRNYLVKVYKNILDTKVLSLTISGKKVHKLGRFNMELSRSLKCIRKSQKNTYVGETSDPCCKRDPMAHHILLSKLKQFSSTKSVSRQGYGLDHS